MVGYRIAEWLGRGKNSERLEAGVKVAGVCGVVAAGVCAGPLAFLGAYLGVTVGNSILSNLGYSKINSIWDIPGAFKSKSKKFEESSVVRPKPKIKENGILNLVQNADRSR